MKVYLKILKTILQSKMLYILLIIFLILWLIFNLFIFNKHSKYSFNDKYFVLKVVDIKRTKNGQMVILKGKEKLVSFPKNKFLYELGDYIKVKGKLNVPQNNTIPYNFNFHNYLFNKGIYFILEIEETYLLKSNNDIFYRFKNVLSNHINKRLSYKYLQTFLLGNSSYIDQTMKRNYQNLGVNHLFAISGMHVSMIILIFDLVCKKKGYLNFFLITFFLLIYLFLVNYQISIIRSFLFYIFFSLNKLLNLKIKDNYLMIIILFIILLINPLYIYDVGFQYSYLISFALVNCKKIIQGTYLKKTFLTSTIAFMVSMPITLYYNFQINYLSVFYNLIYVPLISFFLFPLSFICLFLKPFDYIYYFFVTKLEEITLFFTRINTQIVFSKPSYLLLLILYLVITYLLISFYHKKYNSIGLLAIILFIYYYHPQNYKTSYIMAFDVSNGDSILLKHQNNVILIDIGAQRKIDYSDKIINFFKGEGIKKVDYLIVTHGDFDHIGSAINLVNNFKISNVIFNVGEFNKAELNLIKLLKERKIPYYQNIDSININNNHFSFLNTKVYDNENDNSSVIYTKINNRKILLMGDSGSKKELDIIKKYNVKDIDILKVGHHGSDTSSCKDFIDTIKPKTCLISVGKNNRYGHPTDKVIDTLNNYCKIYRTDLNGSVRIDLNRE